MATMPPPPLHLERGPSLRSVGIFISILLGTIPCALAGANEKIQPGANSPTATEVLLSIQTKGPKVTLGELTSDQGRWDRVTDAMARGDQDWLDVLRDLYKVADGGAALDLGIAAAEALATAPKRVLETLEPSVGLQVLCQNDDSVGTHLAEALRLIDRRRSAVKGIRDEKLREMRDKCLAMLDELEKAMRASKERGDIE